MVAAGFTSTGTTDSVEIIDLESSATNCSIQSFPIHVYGSSGGLSFQEVPVICGGLSNSSAAGSQYEQGCYSYVNGVWNQTYTTNESKRYVVNFL